MVSVQSKIGIKPRLYIEKNQRAYRHRNNQRNQCMKKLQYGIGLEPALIDEEYIEARHGDQQDQNSQQPVGKPVRLGKKE